ncbi:MAG: helix-turn-helix transcriptional regulator [Oscillospiraceae bacterium]|nr:helix-turn-helix transcriptional regulator [Oscillospiraceae bacterium]
MVKNLRSLRSRHHISQQALASRIGVSQQSVNKYENHKVEPDIRTLILLADFFGTSVDYLIGHTSEAPAPGLSEEETALLCDYRRLSEPDRQCLLLVLQRLLAERPKPQNSHQEL